MFIKENLNPKKLKVGDCVVRAIAKAENKAWLEVYDALVHIGRKVFAMPNNKEVYTEYLNHYEKVTVFHMVGSKKKRYTVKEIGEWSGTYIVSVANHLTVVVDGNYYDTWDCGKKCAYIIWKVA